MMILKAPTKKPIVLSAVHPNQGVEATYRRKLLKLIEEMHKSIEYWLTAAYKANPPRMAQDDLPSNTLRKALEKVGARWQKNFDDYAPKLAKYYATEVQERADGALQSMLKKAGFTVAFSLSPVMQDVLRASINENVALIKSIGSQHFSEIEGLVMRSVQQGRDLGWLHDELLKRYAITRRRAALIARDQNNKATASITRTRQKALGIKQAIWLHSHGGRKPRPTHVANDGRKYNIETGWYDPHEKQHVWPGTLINCRCVCKPVIPGL